METKKVKTETYVITDVEHLDAVRAYVTNYCADSGMITIDCFGQAWSNYWGGMGDETPTLQEFFLSANNDYILGKLLSGKTYQTDFEAISKELQKGGYDIEVCSDIDIAHCERQMDECFGQDWMLDLPICATSEYVYLGRIVDAIKAAFAEERRAL